MKKWMMGLVLIGFAAWAGPIIVGNGGGTSEYSMIFARMNLQRLLQDCVDLCGLESGEQKQLTFLISKVGDAPGLWFEKSKVLGSELYQLRNANQELWVNQDLLWLDSNKTVPYQVAHSLGLWIEVLAKTQNISDVGVLQKKVISNYEQRISLTRYETEKNESFESLLWKRDGGSDVLVIRDPAFQTIDVISLVKENLPCAGRMTKLQVYSPAWIPLGSLKPTPMPIFSFEFGIKWQCEGSGGNSSAKIIVSTKLNQDQILGFDLDSIIVQTR